MASREEINEVLRELVKMQASHGPLPSASQNATISSAILSAPAVEKYNFQLQEGADPRGPSPIMRVLDLLSRPLYAVANPIKTTLEAPHVQDLLQGRASFAETLERHPDQYIQSFTDIGRGLTGKDKTTGSDILEAAGMESGAGRGVAGFGLDVALDPLTYLGVGLASKLGQGTKQSVAALRGVEEGTEQASRELTENISRRAAGLSENPPVPKPTIPLKDQVQDPPRTFMAGPGPSTPSKELATIDPATAVSPTSVTEMLQQISSQGRNWERLRTQQVSIIPPNASKDVIRAILQSQVDSVKSPVQKNMIKKQLAKLDEGVVPAVAATAAKVEFPKITLSTTRQTEALGIANSFMRTNKFEEINPVGQTNLFNRVQNWVLKNVPAKARGSVAYQMLRIAEDALLTTGRKLVDREGLSTRLSDIATAAGGSKALTNELVDAFRAGRAVQAVEDTKAATAAITAQDILDPVLSTASKTSLAAKAVLAPSRIEQLGGSISDELAKIAKTAGASSVEAKKAKEFMLDLFNPGRDELYEEIHQQARQLIRRSMYGEIDAHIIHKVNNKIYNVLQANPKFLGKAANQSKVVEAIMMRFATWFNAKDLRPFAREYIDTARNVAAAFERAMTPLVRNSTRSQRQQAFRAAQGRVAAGPDDGELAGQFQAMVESLLGTHGAHNAEAVVFRSGLTLKEINKELPPQLRFMNKKGSDALGREFDYTEGNWMHSWREWDIEEPAEALYSLTRSMQLALRKNAMLDDAAARWGMPVSGGEFKHTVDIDRLKGFYFPKEIAQQLNAVWHRLETDKFKIGPPILQLFDKIQRMWKTGVTIYSPSHHIRNLNGDIFLAGLDGVTTTTPYLMAAKVQWAHKGKYKDMESVLNIADPKLRQAATTARPGDALVTTAGGHKLTNQQIYEAAESQGFLLRAPLLEDLVGDTSQLSGTFNTKFSPFGGRVHRTAAGASEMRDHFVRLAHFIDVLRKSKFKNLRDAIEEAGRRVKKWHPDGSDLTGFEQSVMRRIIPFYSWMRKSTPIIFEGMAMRPHITMAFPKAMSNLQEITGIESQGPGDPFPMDQMFPDWLREKGIGPLYPAGHPFGDMISRQETWKGETPGYTIVNPTNPFTDQISELGNPRKALISSITPALGLPIEFITGHTSLGIPLEEVEGGAAGYLATQVPPVGIGARVTGLSRSDEPWQPEQLINWLLTGSLVTGSGPYRQQASIEIQEMFDKMVRKERRKER
jgi:hypothetical protein